MQAKSIIERLNELKIEKNDNWIQLVNDMKNHYTEGLVPADVFLRYSIAVLCYNMNTLWQAEDEFRIKKHIRKYIGIADDKPFVQASSVKFSYDVYSAQTEDFSCRMSELIDFIREGAAFPVSVSYTNYSMIMDKKLPSKPFETISPYYLATTTSSDFYCTGGCGTGAEPFTVKEEFDPATMSRKKIYRRTIGLETQLTPSTQLTVVKKSPGFPVGKVCGRYKFYPQGKGKNFFDGGMRKRGMFKANTPDLPLITYVTIVYNNKDTILRCMQSVWAQTYPNIEYIVVDGSSTDGTSEIIKQHLDKIDYYVRQPDKGIYDAMNKGISLATGQFICFMNSDDTCPPNAAYDVVKSYIESPADVIFGNVKLRTEDGTLKDVNTAMQTVLIKDNVIRYPTMYHQTVYGGRDAFERTGDFDLAYRLAADLKWTNGCVRSGNITIRKIDSILAYFSLGGASDTGRDKTAAEVSRLVKELFPLLPADICNDLFYCLKRSSNNTYRSFKPVYKAVKKYLADKDFREMFYRTLVYSIYEEFQFLVTSWQGLSSYGKNNSFLEQVQSVMKTDPSWKPCEHPEKMVKQLYNKIYEEKEIITDEEIERLTELKDVQIDYSLNAELFRMRNREKILTPAQIRKKYKSFAKDVRKSNGSIKRLVEREKEVYYS